MTSSPSAPRPWNLGRPETGWTRALSARLGVGTGFALASKLVHPDKEVLCYYGDGSFGMTAFDMETANRFGAPYIAVIGNNSAMNQIRYGQLSKYGEERGNVGNLLGDVPFSRSSRRCWADTARRSPTATRSPRRCAGRVSRYASTGKSAVINIWVNAGRMGTRHQAPDHVQVTLYTSNPYQQPGNIHGQGTLRHSHPGHDPRPGGSYLQSAHGLPRRRRHQARVARGRRHPQAALGRSGRRQPLLHHAELQQAIHHGEPEEPPGQGSLHAAREGRATCCWKTSVRACWSASGSAGRRCTS